MTKKELFRSLTKAQRKEVQNLLSKAYYEGYLLGKEDSNVVNKLKY